jgi:hypothetical protein
MEEVKNFAKWIIIHTQDVDTMGPCRRYKNMIRNIDELYDIYIKLKINH